MAKVPYLDSFCTDPDRIRTLHKVVLDPEQRVERGTLKKILRTEHKQVLYYINR
jgi:hypothetical protein